MASLPYQHWIFDMDGTLTLAAHDFPAIKRALGLPVDRGILECLAEMPPHEAEPLQRRLDELELEIARQAEAARGAHELLAALLKAGRNLALLTRNTRRNALATLTAAGLRDFFADELIVGRDEAAPKPAPDGIELLRERLSAPAERCVMVGDFRYDLEAARAAGVAAVYVDPSGAFPHAALADLSVRHLDQLSPHSATP